MVESNTEGAMAESLVAKVKYDDLPAFAGTCLRMARRAERDDQDPQHTIEHPSFWISAARRALDRFEDGDD